MLRHLIPHERTGVQSATLPALPRASTSLLANDRTAGTARTVY